MYRYFNQLLKVNPLAIHVVFKRFYILNLINLCQIHLIFYHLILWLYNVFLTFIVIDFLFHWNTVLVLFNIGCDTVSLELFQYLLTCHYLLNLSILFWFLISVENVLDCLQFFVNKEKFSFVFAGTTTFVNYRYVAFDKVEFLKSKQRHVETQVWALFVDLVSVTWSYTAEYREPIWITSQIEIDLEVWYAFKDLKDGFFILFEKLLFNFIVCLDEYFQNLLVLHGNRHFPSIH